MPLWALLPIMLGTIAADWTVMVLVGRRLSRSLTAVAQQAVSDGAEDVKKHLLALVPLMVPTIVKALRDEIEKAEKPKESEVCNLAKFGCDEPMPHEHHFVQGLPTLSLRDAV